VGGGSGGGGGGGGALSVEDPKCSHKASDRRLPDPACQHGPRRNSLHARRCFPKARLRRREAVLQDQARQLRHLGAPSIRNTYRSSERESGHQTLDDRRAKSSAVGAAEIRNELQFARHHHRPGMSLPRYMGQGRIFAFAESVDLMKTAVECDAAIGRASASPR